MTTPATEAAATSAVSADCKVAAVQQGEWLLESGPSDDWSPFTRSTKVNRSTKVTWAYVAEPQSRKEIFDVSLGVVSWAMHVFYIVLSSRSHKGALNGG